MLNHITIQGRLARNPEAFTAANDKTGANFVLANEMRNKSVQYIRCTGYGKMGTAIMNTLSKGTMVNVEGELNVTTRKNKDGVYKTYADIIVERFHFCGPKAKSAEPDAPDTTESPDNDSAVNDESSNTGEIPDLQEIPDDEGDELPF